jgi:AcrR family transcriptional regulator
MKPLDPRKTPRHQRSRSIVDAIIEGAARLLESDRAKDLTTNRVAEIAGVSIGSLYQYFPGKQAIVAAVAQKRIRDTYDALLDRIEQSRELPLDDAVSAVVDSFVDMKIEHDKVDAGVIERLVRQGLVDEAAFTLDAEYVARFAAALESWKPKVRAELDAELGAFVLFQSLRAVMILGSLQRKDLVTDVRMRDELKTLMLSYLAPRGEHRP